MPQSSSSSSSEDEQLARLQSVAVSFDDVTSSHRQALAKGKERLRGNSRQTVVPHQPENRSAGGDGSDGEDAGAGAVHAALGARARDTGPEPLDATQLKIASLLSARLDNFIVVKAKKAKRKGRHREDSDADPDERPPQQEEAAAAGAQGSGTASMDVGQELCSSASGADGGLQRFRFFRKVQRGTPCILDKPEPVFVPSTRPDLRSRRDPSRALDVLQPKQVKKVLKTLVVDGVALQAAAAAAAATTPRPAPGTSAAAGGEATSAQPAAAAGLKGQGGQQAACDQQPEAQAGKKKKRKKKTKLRLEGVVLEGRPHVSMEERMLKLLGSAAAVGHGRADAARVHAIACS